MASQILTSLDDVWCSFLMEYDIHTILDGLTLAATAWVIYELRGPLKGTYQADQDNVQAYYVVFLAPLPLALCRNLHQQSLEPEMCNNPRSGPFMNPAKFPLPFPISSATACHHLS